MLDSGFLSCIYEPSWKVTDTTSDEWLLILTDEHSVDNGNGSIHINCNPESKYFGKMIIFSSCDEGIGTLTSFTFDYLLKALIIIHPVYLENISIVDWINGLPMINDSDSDSYNDSDSCNDSNSCNKFDFCIDSDNRIDIEKIVAKIKYNEKK